MNYLLVETTTNWNETTWGQVLLAAVLIVFVNSLFFLSRRLIRVRKLRKLEVIPKVRGLSLSDMDEKHFQLQVSAAPQPLVEAGLRLAVAVQGSDDMKRQVVTEPTPVPQNTLVIPRDLAPIGSTL
jgi:hypothetical protein